MIVLTIDLALRMRHQERFLFGRGIEAQGAFSPKLF